MACKPVKAARRAHQKEERMKQWKYAWGWKAAALVINQICAVAMVLSIGLCLLYVGIGGIGLLRRDENFEDTAYYQNEVREQVYRCIRAASRESKFENQGVYDAETLVNLEDYADNRRILTGSTDRDGVYYRLIDLLNWGQEGYFAGDLLRIEYQDGRVAYSSQGSYTRTVISAYEEEVSYEMDAYLNNQDSAILRIDTIEAVEERYRPAGYESLIGYAQANNLNVNELQNLYNNLQEVISDIYNDYYAYTENLELFSPAMTNMRYMLLPEGTKGISAQNFEKMAYTNLVGVPKELTGADDFLNYFRGYPDYMIYNTADMSFECENMPFSIGDINDYLKGYAPSVEGSYIFAAAIDPSYAANDNLRAYKMQYEELKPVSQLAFYGLFLGSVLYFLSLVYLTLAAGHRVTDELGIVHLNWFDRIKTEIGAALVIVPAAGALYVGFVALRRMDMGNLRHYCFVSGALLFILNIFFLCGYLSLARRVKERTVWRNSVLCAALRFLNTVIANRRMTTRALLEYLLFLAANCVLLCFKVPGFVLACMLDAVVGVALLRRALQRQMVLDGIYRLTEGDLDYQIPLEKVQGDLKVFAEAVNHVGKGLSQAVAKGVKDEKLKSDLITNVSHDIKTPLTSIINYVELLKREDIPNEKAKSYIGILEEKAHRLKHLTEDLVEASKISSGNVNLEFIRINFQEMIQQTNGEFYEKFEGKGLQLVTSMPEEPVVIEADGRRLWRIIENVYNNVAKYAMPNTRVYVDMTVVGHMVRLNVKNISEQPLNIDASELTERFIRGDVSRGTEGSGLGLSIAKNLTQLQKGSFEIYLDGDLFRVTIIFPLAPEGGCEGGETCDEKGVEFV